MMAWREGVLDGEEISVTTVAALALLSFINLPALQEFSEPHFVTVGGAK